MNHLPAKHTKENSEKYNFRRNYVIYRMCLPRHILSPAPAP